MGAIDDLVFLDDPSLFPAIAAGWLLAFTLSLDDFVITFFTNGPGSTTLPIYVYGLLRRIITPQEIAAMAVYLGSAEASGITGQSLHIDGGMVLS